jgi:predicted esterase
MVNRDVFTSGRLIVRYEKVKKALIHFSGLRKLQLDNKRDGLIYIPAGYDARTPAPLAVMLHGAGGNADHGMSLLKPFADASNLILIAPVSRSGTWDIIAHNRFGPDVIFINQALAQAFSGYNINTSKIAVGGFSDGASYALSIGLINGDLFSHIIAFSPGFFYAPAIHGKPRVFVSHGALDSVLPIQVCSMRIVPQLQKKGYDILYHEFDGPHIIPPLVVEEAVKWFVSS